jgi:hypothetical protein
VNLILSSKLWAKPGTVRLHHYMEDLGIHSSVKYSLLLVARTQLGLHLTEVCYIDFKEKKLCYITLGGML